MKMMAEKNNKISFRSVGVQFSPNLLSPYLLVAFTISLINGKSTKRRKKSNGEEHCRARREREGTMRKGGISKAVCSVFHFMFSFFSPFSSSPSEDSSEEISPSSEEESPSLSLDGKSKGSTTSDEISIVGEGRASSCWEGGRDRLLLLRMVGEDDGKRGGEGEDIGGDDEGERGKEKSADHENLWDIRGRGEGRHYVKINK